MKSKIEIKNKFVQVLGASPKKKTIILSLFLFVTQKNYYKTGLFRVWNFFFGIWGMVSEFRTQVSVKNARYDFICTEKRNWHKNQQGLLGNQQGRAGLVIDEAGKLLKNYLNSWIDISAWIDWYILIKIRLGLNF